MKNTLVIGSTVLDIIIDVNALPNTTEDLHVQQQTMVLGGCAYNVQNIVQLFEIPNLFCSPIGTGVYGDYVAKQLSERGIEPFLRIKEEDSGCCYCFVEPHGERTFLSYHGAEYTFQEHWLKDVNMEEFDSAYICGLEIEEPTGGNIIAFLEKHRELEVFFAPGPRIKRIEAHKLEALFSLSPIVHLNRDEICAYAGTSDLKEAAKALYAKTSKTLVVTDGDKGAYYFDETGLHHVHGYPAQVVNTIGAGDAHVGAVMACRKLGYSYAKSLDIANQISAKVVAAKESHLTVADFQRMTLA